MRDDYEPKRYFIVPYHTCLGLRYSIVATYPRRGGVEPMKTLVRDISTYARAARRLCGMTGRR